MNIIHLISDLSPINYGIWNVVVNTIPYFEIRNVNVLICTPNISNLHTELKPYSKLLAETNGLDILNKRLSSFDSKNTIVISHGCWGRASYWGYKLWKQKGYKWIHYPHGMLEPWAIKHKWIKKILYFKMFEKRYLKNADKIVAVGAPEYDTLRSIFGRKITHIPNGVVTQDKINKNFDGVKDFLFMSRLHKKKGIKNLVEAWLGSSACDSSKYRLLIAGPDEGELQAIKEISKNVSNISFLGPVYGDKKKNILCKSHFFILPSFSEGFPSSVVEAMSYGLIPIITKGCNFPEVFHAEMGIEILPEVKDIKNKIDDITNTIDVVNYRSKSDDARLFVNRKYAIEHVVTLQYELYKSLLNEN